MAAPWRMARSLDQLLAEVNAHAPRRSKESDGGIGNAEHATRESDHNPWVKDVDGVGVVTARDFTHDPAGGLDAHKLAEHLRQRALAGDHRVKYVISRSRIFNPAISRSWRTYRGPNPHNTHAHLSVSSERRHYHNTAGWGVADASIDGDSTGEGLMGELSKPAKGGEVHEWQQTLWDWAHDKRLGGWKDDRLRECGMAGKPKYTEGDRAGWCDASFGDATAQATRFLQTDLWVKPASGAVTAQLVARVETKKEALVIREMVQSLRDGHTRQHQRIAELEQLHPGGDHLGQTPPDPDGGFLADYDLASAYVLVPKGSSQSIEQGEV